MPNELDIARGSFSAGFSSALEGAASIITKDYLDRLESFELMAPSAEDADIDIASCGRFYRLTKLVLNKEENFLNKLTTVVNAASSLDCSIATIISSDGGRIDYRIGIVSKKDRDGGTAGQQRREAASKAFKGALGGNLAGSELRELSAEEVRSFRESVLGREGSCYSSVSGIVALRDESDRTVEGYVQGLENLVDSLKGLKYTIVMLADPVDTQRLQAVKQGYEMLYTQLSSFARCSATVSESDTLSLSKARTDGIAEGLSEGIALTQSKSQSRGYSAGINGSVGLSFLLQASAGFSAGANWSSGESSGRTDSTAQTSMRSKSVTDTSSSAKTSGRTLELNYENRSVKALLDKIDKHLERLDECDSFGAFECAAYVIADDRETALAAAGNYSAIMRGQNSSVQAFHINSWYKPEDTECLRKYLASLVHPRFKFVQTASGSAKSIVTVTPASLISGGELSIQIGLPKKSVAGITVIPMAPFGRNVPGSEENVTGPRPIEGRSRRDSAAAALELGTLYHMGCADGGSGREQRVKIDIESLAMHTFITGSTGKGKSTAIYGILDKLRTRKAGERKPLNGRTGPADGSNRTGAGQRNIRFMVIEPAKGEYKDRFGNYPDVSVYGTNYKKTPLLRINPFSFPDDVHVLEHIDRLIEIFNVCWPMYAAMPAVLKDAVEGAYLRAGWDLETSDCRYRDAAGRPLYPSFADVLLRINAVMDASAYSADNKGDYKGALCTRLKSLTNGLFGKIFTDDELPPDKLFDENVIVDLSRVGSGETKALIMGILVMKLQEYRMSRTDGGNAPLKHVTVLEEAHNILKRTSTQQISESSNLLGKAVEMLANAIAEMRTFGEGFIIADQSPGLMDLSVIRNTNTKIILGLPDLADRELVGRAAGLSDDQISELSRLKTFVAAVYQNNWLEPVLCCIDHDFPANMRYRCERQTPTRPLVKRRIIEYLLLPIFKRNELKLGYAEELINKLYGLPLPAEAKIAFTEYVKATTKEDVQKLRQRALYHICGAEAIFVRAKSREKDIAGWYACIHEALAADPDIMALNGTDRKKLICILAKEQGDLDGSGGYKELFNSLNSYLKM